MTTYDKIEQTALALSEAERERLVEKLYASLNKILPEVEEAWLAEIESRYDAYLAGKTTPISASRAHDEIRKEMGWN